MATALFVYDHKFPKDVEGNYYYSSGFDEEFFKRYFNIFDQFNVFGRVRYIKKVEGFSIVEYPSKFLTVESNKKILGTATWGILKDAISNADCVVIRMPSIFGSIAINMARHLRKPYIVEIVGCAYDSLRTSKSLVRKTLAIPTELYYRHIMKKNLYSVYVTKEFLQKKYPNHGKSIACSNVTLEMVSNDILNKRKIRILNFNPNEKLVVGTCAVLDVDYKGQQYVIKALKDIVDLFGYKVEYQLVGDGNPQRLINIAQKNNVLDKINIVGKLPHKEVFLWLDSIDIYIHPSCTEGLSRAIIEAMSRACPVIACDVGGNRELVNSKYLIAPKNVKQVVKSIGSLCSEDLTLIAKENFNRSKDYIMEVLYQRREHFFQKFMKEEKVK